MNRQFINILILLIISGNILCNAQQKKATASFVAESHDFGKINESDGPVTFQFTFTNIGSEPLILKNVTASCGCTTPSWSREPVLPGAKGFITVTYNPQNRPGHFEKTITVNSNGDPETQALKISGDVIPRQPTVEDSYPQVMDSLRLKSMQIAFNNISPSKILTQTAEVYNSSHKPMKIDFMNIPKHLKVKITPETIAPKGKANIEVTYDASQKNDWGFVIDNIFFTINGKSGQNGNRLSISANITEDFSQLTEEQKAIAPKLVFKDVNFVFDTVKQGDKVDHEYVFNNNGKSDLIIHKVQPSCGCTVTSLKSQIIKPGESGTIFASFDSHGKNGSQSKTITVISNDPTNYHVVLWIKGVVK